MNRYKHFIGVILFAVVFLMVKANASISEFNAREEAMYAVEELKKLSDSGIYSTLSLSKIVDASVEDGIFHTNTILRLELQSQFFRSKKDHETFNVIVMKHKEDGVKSFAIDEFPLMDEDAIEKFWILKVEEKRRRREEAFRRLEIEALLLGEEASYTDEVKMAMRNKIDSRSVSDLLFDFDTPSLRKYRQEQCTNMLKQLTHQEYKTSESRLSEMSLQDLFAVTVDIFESSDYEKYRAKQLLDNSMAYLQQRFSDTRSAAYFHPGSENLLTVVIGSPVADSSYRSKSSNLIGSLVAAWKPKHFCVGADHIKLPTASMFCSESNLESDEGSLGYESRHEQNSKNIFNGMITIVSSISDFISTIISMLTNIMKTDLRKFEEMERKVEEDLNNIHIPSSGITCFADEIPVGAVEAVQAAKDIKASIILCEHPHSEATHALREAILKTRSIDLKKVAMDFKVIDVDFAMASKERILQAICCRYDEVLVSKGKTTATSLISGAIPLIWDALTRERAGRMISKMVQKESLPTECPYEKQVQVVTVILVPRFVASFVGEELCQRLGYQSYDEIRLANGFLTPFGVEIEGDMKHDISILQWSNGHRKKKLFAEIMMRPFRKSFSTIAEMAHALLAGTISSD